MRAQDWFVTNSERKTRTQMMMLEQHLRAMAEKHGGGFDLARLLAEEGR